MKKLFYILILVNLALFAGAQQKITVVAGSPGGGGSSVTVTNNLTTSTTGTALDAAQGKTLKDLVDANTTAIAGKQGTLTLTTTGSSGAATLVSGTLNIPQYPGGTGSGTVNSGTQYRLAYYATTGTAVSQASAITASRALISDANGVPTHSAVTATELGYVSGVTSAIQTQITANGTSISTNASNITTLQNRTISTGWGLSGGGNLTANRTLIADSAAMKVVMAKMINDSLNAQSTIEWIVRETPSGSVNSSNTVFTLAYTPVTGKEMVFKNGLLQDLTSEYTISSATITFVVAPTTGDKIRVTYLK